MSTRTERINEAVAYLKGRQIIKYQRDIITAMDADKSTVSQALMGNEKYLTDSFIERFCEAFLELNPSWLLTGEGNILKGATTETLPITSGKMIPFYDAEAVAGGNDYEVSVAPAYPVSMIEIGALLKDSESALRVYGNSMVPNYPAGCVVGLRRHTESFIEPGYVYVIETSENRYLKRIYATKDKVAIRCVSDNHMAHESGPMTGELYYPEFEIPLKEINRIFRVVGVIKRNVL